MFSRFFIDRPIFATVASILVVLAGLFSIKILPVQQYPSFTPPQITVQATYPGADALTLAQTVAAPLEEAINGAKNMLYMTTTASPSGIVRMSVVFDAGTDPAQANVDVNNRVQTALSKLPEPVRNQGVTIRERSPDMLRVIGFTSEGRKHDALWLNNYALVNVLDDIKRIPGVGEARLFGSREYAIRIWPEPDKLAAYDLTVNDLLAAVRSQNVQLAAGQIGDRPYDSAQTYTYTVTTEGRLKSPEAFGQIIVRSEPDGSALKLKDVANIELGAERYLLHGAFDGEPMAVMGIFLSPGANALEVADRLDATLETVAKEYPEDVRHHTLNDNTKFVRASIEQVLKTLAEAVLLVTVIIYFFLGNLRATMIPLLAIPVSIVGTFAGLYMAGFSINILTLFALVLAIGLVVDDAIVVIENVERILRENDDITVREATIRAMGEITNPVIAIVFVLCAVFIPAALVEGLTGMMYQQFTVTIVIAVVISGLVALTLTPALCALFLKKEESRPFLPIRLFHAFFARLTEGFMAGTRLFIRRAVFTLTLFGALVGAAFLIVRDLSTGLVPGEDMGTLMIMTQLPPGASLERTIKVQEETIRTALAHPDMHDVGAMSGIDRATFAFKSDAGVAFAHLNDWSERPGKEHSSQAVAADLMKTFSQNKEARIIAVNPPPIRGLSATGGFQFFIQDRTGGDMNTLAKYVDEIVEKANARPELARVRTKLDTRMPQYKVTVKREKAEAMGVPTADIYTTLGATFGTGYVNDFNLFGRTYHVNLQLAPAFRDDPDDYRHLFVRSATGALIPVSDLVTVERTVGPGVIQRFNMFNAAQISGVPGEGYGSGDAIKAIEQVVAEVLPPGYTLAWSGLSYQEKKVEKEGNKTFFYAILFVFLILAALYESWFIPFAVLMTVPFALFGAGLGVYLRELQNDVYFQVGLITLVGLTAKNAILIVEFAQHKLREGLSLYDATIQGAKIRFRPIVMTSLAFIGGTLPLALSSGAGANGRHIIGTTVVSGMVMLTAVAIFFIPLFYYLIMRGRAAMAAKKGASHEA